LSAALELVGFDSGMQNIYFIFLTFRPLNKL